MVIQEHLTKDHKSNASSPKQGKKKAGDIDPIFYISFDQHLLIADNGDRSP